MPSAATNSGSTPPRSPRPLPGFRQHQARASAGAAPQKQPEPPVVDRKPPEKWTAVWWRQIREWATGPDGRACAASLLLHSVLLTAFSLMAFHHSRGQGQDGVMLRQGEADSVREGLENLLEGEFESAGGGEPLSSTTTFLSDPASSSVGMEVGEPVRPEVDLQSTVAGLNLGSIDVGNPSDLTQEIGEATENGKGRGRGSGVGNGIGNLTDGFARPGGGRVVKKGKFAAWTVPSDPRPYQNYLIVIEVEYPKTKEMKLLRKRRNDLTGTIEGTDTYFQIIEKTGSFIPKSNQMVIPVPGGAMNVRDVIHVRSTILEEAQELTIVF